MPDPVSTQPAVPAKWWATSVTIWGAVVTAAATVLPTIEPLLGTGITAELVRQLGDQVVLAAQAIGGVAGTVLTIYGRIRATTPLERRQVKVTV